MPARTAKSCGPDIPTQISSLRETTRGRRSQQSPVSGENTKEAVKTIAQGMPDESGEPVVTTLVCFLFFAREANVADLTFASMSPRVLHANVKSKATLEFINFWCPFGSDIRKDACCDTIRMSEPGHQRVHRAPGIPCALSFFGARMLMHDSGEARRGDAGACLK
jgi:hypothetical protein